MPGAGRFSAANRCKMAKKCVILSSWVKARAAGTVGEAGSTSSITLNSNSSRIETETGAEAEAEAGAGAGIEAETETETDIGRSPTGR